MRVLLVTRGAPGSGKSTWIKENGLQMYSLSADELRLKTSSPSILVNGSFGINQKENNKVWDLLFQILETRMKNGSFTVIDATTSTTKEINKIKNYCKEYKYRMFLVDFTSVPIDIAKERNLKREELKQVPDSVIDKMYKRFESEKIPSGVTVIQPNELEKVWFQPINLSEYEVIHHIGDIHGCNTVLQEYFNNNGGIKDNEFYIFTGDYIDRGIENVEVIKFLLSIADKDNVLLLEGNHEKWLKAYSKEQLFKSEEFEKYTKPALEQSNISKKDLRKLYNKMGQCAYYKYYDKIFLVTHGGLPSLPSNITFIDAEQMICGVGSYSDDINIAETFASQTNHNIYQVHGHRNKNQLPIKVNDKVYNLENKVEFGGNLRCAQVSKKGIKCIEIKNTVYRDFLEELYRSPYIKEKSFGNISSFNFTAKAFQNGIWNKITTKARALYIDTNKRKVVARAYDKFWNIEEREETSLDNLQKELSFPVTVYVKENGFLGLVSFNDYTEDLLITSKSSLNSEHSKWLKEILYEKIPIEKINELKKYLKEHNVTFVFECIDVKNDPHIIEYNENKLVLLDVVYNDIEFKKYTFEELKAVSNMFLLSCKERVVELKNWKIFVEWYNKVLEENYTYNNKYVEGFVLEDKDGYMTKIKTFYYNYWKCLRKHIEKITIDNCNNFSVKEHDFVTWYKKKYNITKNIKDIITLRNMYLNSKGEES